jgi:hypothetical protein
MLICAMSSPVAAHDQLADQGRNTPGLGKAENGSTENRIINVVVVMLRRL